MEPPSSSVTRGRRGVTPPGCSAASCGSSGPTIVPPTEMSKEEWMKEVERREFYKNYNAMDGAITAIVLGGFFAFVCLLVVYKTKCKPMWKNRRRKLTNTPATQSNAEVDICGSLHNNGGGRSHDIIQVNEQDEDEDEEDEEVLRVGGTIQSPPILSVTPAAEDLGFECIPLQLGCFSDDLYYLDECGNYLFPVPCSKEDEEEPPLCSCSASHQQNTLEPRRNSQVSSVSNAYTVKSLPGAYLYIPIVDPKSIGPHGSVKRSLSDPEIHFSSPSPGQPLILTVNPSSESTAKRGSLGAFPNSVLSSLVSRPTASYREKKGLHGRSFSIQGGETTASINIHITTPTPTLSPALSLHSFSGGSGGNSGHPLPLESVEESVGESEPLPGPDEGGDSNNNEIQPDNSPCAIISSPANVSSNSSTSSKSARATYRRSRMLSLQEPSSGVRQRRLRTMRQLTLPSTSGGHLRVPSGDHPTSSSSSPSGSVQRSGSFCSILSDGDGDIFDAQGMLKKDTASSQQQHIQRAKHSISEYSDLIGEECPSEISELCLPSGPARLAREEEELSERLVGSSSCSGSSLDSESTSIHQFTVPVTIEHPPPGLRSPLPAAAAAADPPEEEDCRPPSTAKEEDDAEGGYQLVLVRDIGIQVSGDSPPPGSSSSPKSSSSPGTVKSHKESPPPSSPPAADGDNASSSSSNQQTDTYVEKFPPEILF